ncbi:E3 ubiquitin-protein ligase synoviolin B [Oopsacas minuta]|uniref:RNA-binding protein NOB1 n=1 Tax=Oopsacas minuta TaxID=111878 RepID=A0AAV7JXK9_9METZ|nr:E3 ubiquitin-protein ligase synoviolin B [Oopsacas minuta]
MSVKPIQHILVDASAFIKLSQLHNWSDSINTVTGVLEEIRNKDSRIAITSLLPYKLQVSNPHEKSIQHVVEFAKKTGDFPVLSHTDIELIAATYEFECTHGVTKGTNLNSTPKRILEPEPISFTKIIKDLPAHQIGFFNGNSEGKIDGNLPENIGEEMENSDSLRMEESMEHSRTNVSDNESSDDDEQGWITPGNLYDVTTLLGGTIQETPQDVQVACVTSDYAIQNVLLQMGLHVLSIDGLLITQVRRYALLCRVCSYTTFNMAISKCIGCGYDMLIRVHAVTNNGMITYQPLSVKQFSKRGLRFSTPKPTGGRHGNVSTNPRNKPRYTRKVEKVNPMDADYIARESPFKYKDVHSKGANIGFKMGSKRTSKNPNQVAKKGTRKKSGRI